MRRRIDRRSLLAGAGALAVSGALPPLGRDEGYVRDELASMDVELQRLLDEHETAPADEHLANAAQLRARAARLGRDGGSDAGRIIARTAGVEAQVSGWERPEDAWNRALLARDLAVHYEDWPAAAMAAGLLSVLDRYAGDPRAVGWAQQARRMVPRRHPVALMLCTTEARARAELPSREEWAIGRLLDEAMAGASDLTADQEKDAPGLSFDSVCPGELQYASAIAWLRSSSPTRAASPLNTAVHVTDTARLPGFSAMLRVERAIYAMRAGRFSLDESCAFVRDALLWQGPHPSGLLAVRLREWQSMARQHGSVGAVHGTIGAVQTWLAQQHPGRSTRG